MEIGASLSSSYLQPQFVEPRGARHATREAVETRERAATVNSDRDENANPSSVFPGNADRAKAAEAQAARNARAEQENLQAARAAAQRAQQQEGAAGGGVKLDVEDGHRVLKVFDSKDVLIYQLPPKGALMLIESQESAQPPQVQTSA